MTFRFFKVLFVVLSLIAVVEVRGDAIDQLIRAEMKSRDIPGLALTIIQSGKTLKQAAYGFANLEWRIPTTPDTVFEVGSVTKQFTGAAIQLLAKDGKLSVDDPITKYLPAAPSSWSSITVRHLLTHTSGIKSYTGLNGFELTERLDQSQFINRLKNLPLEFKPGSKSKYNNSGYSLLGYIVENVSGKKYWDFLGQRIIGPLGMNSTTNRDPRQIILHRADGYEKREGIRINRDYDLTDVFSAGEMVSTVGDLAKWSLALDGDGLFSAAEKTALWAPGNLQDGSAVDYGFGWRLDPFKGHKVIGHSGSTSGFSASLQRFPDANLAVIILCNAGEEGVATVLARSVAEIYLSRAQKKR